MYTQKEYDKIIDIALTNFYTLNKRGCEIKIYNFNIKDEGHLCLLHILTIANTIFDAKVKIKTSLLNYIKIRYKVRVNFLKRAKKGNVDIVDFISHIENANNKRGIFKEIYRDYYRREDR